MGEKLKRKQRTATNDDATSRRSEEREKNVFEDTDTLAKTPNDSKKSDRNEVLCK